MRGAIASLVSNAEGCGRVAQTGCARKPCNQPAKESGVAASIITIDADPAASPETPARSEAGEGAAHPLVSVCEMRQSAVLSRPDGVGAGMS